MTDNEIQRRKEFEKWITDPPFEKNIDRWPNNETLHAWPGQYKDADVQLAWAAWIEVVDQSNK